MCVSQPMPYTRSSARCHTTSPHTHHHRSRQHRLWLEQMNGKVSRCARGGIRQTMFQRYKSHVCDAIYFAHFVGKWTERKEEMWNACSAHTAKRSWFWLLKVGKMEAKWTNVQTYEITTQTRKCKMAYQIRDCGDLYFYFLFPSRVPKWLQLKQQNGGKNEAKLMLRKSVIFFFLCRCDALNCRSIRVKLNARIVLHSAQLHK